MTYTYSSTGDLHDDEASRVTKVTVTIGSNVTVAEYQYLGASQVVGIDYPEPDVFMHQYGSTSGSYPNLDRFNRVTSSVWTKDLATDRDLYDVDISYDRNSNITELDEHVHAGFDVDFTIENQNRLTDAQEGTLSGGSITNETRQQTWATLSQTGNWTQVQLDLDGNGTFTGTGEYNDKRTHNDANELTGRDTNADLTDEFNPVHSGTGTMTDDDEFYENEFDAFGRLRKVKNTGTQALVAEYTYNGLGHRIGWHYDVDADGTVETNGDDPWYRFVYDERWRILATYRESDSSPKEQFVYHSAGNDGLGGASYIDDVILRDKDANTAWSAASDGTLEERIYYSQNWRHDVVALIDDTGNQVEQVRYTAYGIPDGLPAGDLGLRRRCG